MIEIAQKIEAMEAEIVGTQEVRQNALRQVQEAEAISTAPGRLYRRPERDTGGRGPGQWPGRGRGTRSRGGLVMIDIVKNIVDKVQSRKLGVTAVAGVAAGTGAVDITWPIAAMAMAYILGQAYVDGRG